MLLKDLFEHKRPLWLMVLNGVPGLVVCGSRRRMTVLSPRDTSIMDGSADGTCAGSNRQ